jgi:AcrR family transcriptional regulator
VTAKLAVYGLTVRDIAREALVADGVLYNYFQDKEDLLAHALLAHVGMVMGSAPPTLEAGSGTVAENLGLFIDRGFALLARVTPAFAGLLAQQGVLSRFHAMVGGDEAFGAVTADDGANPEGQPDRDGHAAVATLIVGAIHGEILPRVLFSPPGSQATIPPDLASRLARTVLDGIEP